MQISKTSKFKEMYSVGAELCYMELQTDGKTDERPEKLKNK